MDRIGIRETERKLHKKSYKQHRWIIPEQTNHSLINLRDSLTRLINVGKRLGEADI